MPSLRAGPSPEAGSPGTPSRRSWMGFSCSEPDILRFRERGVLQGSTVSLDPLRGYISELMLLLAQRSHVDREAVLHIRLHQPLVGLIHLLNRNHLNVRGNVVVSAEIQHLLCLRDTTNN